MGGILARMKRANELAVPPKVPPSGIITIQSPAEFAARFEASKQSSKLVIHRIGPFGALSEAFFCSVKQDSTAWQPILIYFFETFLIFIPPLLYITK